ncbi:cell division protein ZapA [Capnocytophaga cynodegmi]|uniref:cell division protein ZapA n=1 Tax=Capnocytophaga cynodegmi TaxID=28189 RepID=UPI00385CC894
MNDTLKIKLSIADRVYPLVIEPQQEEGFRKAAKEINEMIHNFERNYELKDKRDALAMCTIVLAAKIEQTKIDENNQDLTIKEKLENISRIMDSII